MTPGAPFAWVGLNIARFSTSLRSVNHVVSLSRREWAETGFGDAATGQEWT